MKKNTRKINFILFTKFSNSISLNLKYIIFKQILIKYLKNGMAKLSEYI